MNIDRQVLVKMIGRALSGEGAHVEAKDVFAGLDWKLAGAVPSDAPHSVFQLLNHIVYWNQWVVDWLAGGDPGLPEHAPGSWPGPRAPQNAEEWKEAVRHFERSLKDLIGVARKIDLLATGRQKTPLEMLQTIASHSSYHLGQVVVLRQMLHAWPPPSGGLTW